MVVWPFTYCERRKKAGIVAVLMRMRGLSLQFSKRRCSRRVFSDPYWFSSMRITLVLCVCLMVSGCNSFEVKRLAKTDIDMVVDLHRGQTRDLVLELTEKLYKRNPRQLAKSSGHTIQSRQESLQTVSPEPLSFPELNGAVGIEAMHLAFDEDFKGDRVFALMAGLTDMLHEAYNYKEEFYITDTVDQQKLYNSARNIEVMVWLLKTTKDSRGQRLILTDGVSGDLVNLSFERLFGKLIAHQDMMARIVSDKTQRAINSVAHGIVSMTFIPI